jgi:deoxyribose-phosphate aldolase
MKSTQKAGEMSPRALAAYIDQSVLKPSFTQDEIRRYIQEGIDYGCKTVCINAAALTIARAMCKGTDTGVCVVCDFPFGLSSTASKVLQAQEILTGGGVDDLDVVVNYGWLRSGMWEEAGAEMRALTEITHRHGAILKVIFETDALTLDEVARATEIACAAGVDFVKTSTGFYTDGASNGATPEVIRVMLDAARGRCKVKGSGGIRDRARFLELIDMGVERMGIGYRSTPVILGVR